MTATQSATAKASVQASFFNRLEPHIQYEPNTGCWLSSLSGPHGYTQVKMGGNRMLGHRASWEHHHGAIPVGSWVLHRCDTPACCNPDHLFLGSPADNTADMVRKGRNSPLAPRHGTDALNAKLTPEAVREIRASYRRSAPGNKPSPNSTVGLARRFGVSSNSVSRVLAGQTWGHVQ